MSVAGVPFIRCIAAAKWKARTMCFDMDGLGTKSACAAQIKISPEIIHTKINYQKNQDYEVYIF